MTIPTLPRTPRSRHNKHARLHMPSMTAEEALAVVALLEKAVEAIWRAHGNAMADRLASAGIETPRPQDGRWDGSPDPEDCGF